MWFALYMSKKAVSEYLRIKWETVGSIVNRVEAELTKNTDRFEHLVNIGIDETSSLFKLSVVIISHQSLSKVIKLNTISKIFRTFICLSPF